MVKNIVPKLSSPPDHNKNRNDPNRFFGDGVTFKAKLIGILEVGEARGDRMCQEALQDLKMAIRAAGEHKQRITIHVTIDGLRLRDEKTGDCLYHHPVHKISFIAQDMTDSRAFGYIFGSPDSGHRFFGIKTDKAASQVVLAMRDLFQVVFELKKKEIELAKQHIQSKTIHENQPLSLSIKNNSGNNDISSLSIIKAITSSEGAKSNHKESPESVADLVDLEQELSSLQRGITQMERITPSEPTATSKSIAADEDPFGDSFANFPPYNLLPPPESTRSRQSKPNKPPESITSISTLLSSSSSSHKKPTTSNSTSMNTTQPSDNWLSDLDQSDVFETTATSLIASKSNEKAHLTPNTSSIEILTSTSTSTPATSQNSGVEYLDLDPLGTGKFKPYVDKKYFFHELKNPPKKVLKDLSGGANSSGASTETNFPSSFYGTDTSGNDLNDIFEVSSESAYDQNKTNQSGSQTEPKTSDFGSQFNATENKIGTTQSNAVKDASVACQKTGDSGSDETVIMMARDTDPFSPTRKKSDPFQDGDIFTNLDPFEFEFSASKTTVATETKSIAVSADDATPVKVRKESSLSGSPNVFNGPLQVSLPPESWPGSASLQSGLRRVERQTSESPTSSMGVRNRPSVFKQNTVDVISSISSKKMPHLFGQKFSKRDSNSINMRRLQESDSLSENETAPEPPPRPDSANHSEPPPLPPKKQFSDVIIRPRITASSAAPPAIRYDYVAAKMKASQNSNTDLSSSAPPIPLPLRKVGRSDASYPGPGRPRKPGNDDDDYLSPVTTIQRNDVPPLLPPPQTKGRGRRQEAYENKTELIEQNVTSKDNNIDDEPETFIPDITLTQLLTLGIDELATKLNVQTSKLSTMTLVELTTYLSEFIEKSKKPKRTPPPPSVAAAAINAVINKIDESPIFKVNFDQSSDSTFVAKFDDNFGEDSSIGFVANFSQCDSKPEESKESFTAAIPPADRYAVFREIMELEQQSDSFEQKSTPDEADDDQDNMFNDSNAFSDDEDKSETYIESSSTTLDQHSQSISQIPKIIDTKITEAISHAKDRYAALRDIILVEDIFEKPVVTRPPSESLIGSFIENSDDFSNNQEDLMENEKSKSIGGCDDESSPESMQNFDDEIAEKSDSGNGSGVFTNKKFMHTLTVGTKDDLEIDELMNRAISNLSLDSRDHLSPNNTKSPANSSQDNRMSTSPLNQQFKNKSSPLAIKSQFNDVSTSPIPIQKSPAQKSPLLKSPLVKSPIPQQMTVVASMIDANKTNTVSPLSDICGSSPDTADPGLSKPKMTSHPTSTAESWAVFDKPPDNKSLKDLKQQRTPSKLNLKNSQHHLKTQRQPKDMLGDSPCSSEGKDEWKGEAEYGNRRWAKGQTSSSSRDLSPWDDEAASEYKKHVPPTVGIDRQGYYMRHSRRMNSFDDDYEYEDEISKRRERKVKTGISRSRDNFELEPPTWYPSVSHHVWSPQDEDGRARSFERGSYDRTTYGPPVYDKRDHKVVPHGFYDRRSDRNYDKRKYYREYARPNYDFETYPDSMEGKERKIPYHGENFEKPKLRRDYENVYDEGFPRDGTSRLYKGRDYFYDRDRKSFDRESVDSYESAGRRRRSFGSGDVYGSVESREEFRERYMGGSEKARSLRKGMKMRTNGDEYEPDSETDVQVNRRSGPVETRSLQRFSQGPRIRKSSGSSPWDGEEPPPVTHLPKGWKRPASATESDRRLAERRVISHSPSGSDGEKERRFRKKQRSRLKDGAALDQPSPPRPSNVQSSRYATHRDNYDYINYDDYDPPIDEDKFERLNRRRHDMHLRMMETERRKKNDQCSYDDDVENIKYPSKKESCYADKDRYESLHKFDAFEDTKVSSSSKTTRCDFDFEDFGETPRSNDSRSKFNFENEHGFESDFSSPLPTAVSLTTTNSASASTGKTFRFSNDFSDKEKHVPTTTTTHTTVALNASSGNLDTDFPSTTAVTSSSSSIQKLRFDDKVTVSKFNNDQPSAFEDDFSKADFDFEKEDQWNPEQPKKNNLRINSNKLRQDMIKKSESVNIFAKKVDDPFEDDEFFKSTSPASEDHSELDQNKPNAKSNGNSKAGDQTDSFQWNSNFAKFDENM